MGADREPETIVAELRPSAGVLVVPSVVLVIAAAAVGFFALRVPDGLLRWSIVGGGLLVVLLGFVLPLWAWSSRSYTVTTRRTVLRSGMLAHHRREVLHGRVLEVVLHRTPAQRVAGTGDILLELGQGRSAVLRRLRAPQLVQEALTDLIEAQREEAAARRHTGEHLL